MGFLDEVDSAFDNLFGDDGDEVKEKKDEKDSAEDEATAQLDELKDALAVDSLVPILGLRAVFRKCHRRYWLAALAGALNYVRRVDENEERNQLTGTLLAQLKTNRGTVRKVLQAGAADQIMAQIDALGSLPGENVATDVRVFVRLLQDLDPIDTEDVTLLFSAGVWNNGHVNGATAEELTLLTQLDPGKVTVLQASAG